ncbi:MAG: 30S ribosomal protein S4 [Christensenellaceae bacterium]|nr:30S ribosomal protein S4 [Christensenellaceae bacterium]
MARNRDAIAKTCRSLGISPATMGYSNKKSTRNPGGDTRKKVSEYGLQLREKQKVRFVYGIMEKQFRLLYERARKLKGNTAENILLLCEERLDNVIYRLGFGSTRRHARQIVNHGHVLVNGKRVNIPSYSVKLNDVISIKDKSKDIPFFKELRTEGVKTVVPKWLSMNQEELSGVVTTLPSREDIDLELQENMIVEFYSR